MESVVEYIMVSVMEAHTPSCRGILNQERLNDEGLVAWSGDSPVDHIFPKKMWSTVTHWSVVREALILYSSLYKMEGFQEGHFIRKSEKIKDYILSQT